MSSQQFNSALLASPMQTANNTTQAATNPVATSLILSESLNSDIDSKDATVVSHHQAKQ